MLDISRYFEEIQNRLTKRYKLLSKWAENHQIDYFRLFDRDITECPFIIDSLKSHWLLWICDSKLTDDELRVMGDMLTTYLRDIKDLPLIVKDRRKGASYDFNYDYEHVFTEIQEGGLLFKLNLTQYLDVGLFIDHRHTRDYIRSIARGKNVLNLFAYTGSVSCYAIDGMAKHTTSVDLNKRYCQWNQENCDLNHFKPDRYTIVHQDVIQYLQATQQKFDIIFCDPPSFSVTKDRRVKPFHVQDNGESLIQLCMDRLTSNGTLFFSTNYKSFKISDISDKLSLNPKELTKKMCPKDFLNKWGSRTWQMS